MENLSSLAEVCAKQALQQAERTAFIDAEQKITFDQLDKLSNQVAHGLLEADIKPSARIAILSRDSGLNYAILFGCSKIKAVLISINWRLQEDEIRYILEDGNVRCLFVANEFVPLVKRLITALPNIEKLIVLDQPNDGWQHYPSDWPYFPSWVVRFSKMSPHFDYDANDTIVQMYTSGTTGKPKGVQLANRSFFRLLEHMRSVDDVWMSLSCEDILLLGLPQFHIGGLWWAIQGFIVGATGVIVDSFVGWKVLQLIERHRISKIAMVPAMIQLVLEEPSCQTTDFSSVTGLLYGGSPISAKLLTQAMQTFGCDFYQIYGMTETGNMAVCLRPEDHQDASTHKFRSAGKPLPGVRIKITDGHGQPLPAYANGEICIQSPSNMLGYWRNEAATRLVLQDGWIRSGDIGYLDADGYLFICDRLKDMIIYAGENIYPAEIERILSEHEDVAEVAVIGIPDEKWGETVKAFVVPWRQGTIKQRDLINFAKQRLADFKVPKSITFVDSLPRNPAGKILKRVLREPFWEHRDKQVC